MQALGWTPISLLMMNSSRARPTPALGKLRETEGELRIADVHRDLDRDPRHLAALAGRDLERNRAGVDPFRCRPRRRKP